MGRTGPCATVRRQIQSTYILYANTGRLSDVLYSLVTFHRESIIFCTIVEVKRR